MKKVLFILFVGIAFVGCEDDDPKNVLEQNPNNDKSTLLEVYRNVKKQRDNLKEENGYSYMGWDTYLNEKEVIIISYPSNWKIQNEKPELGIIISTMREDSTEKIFRENFHLAVSEIEDSLDIEDIANEFFSNQKVVYSNLGRFRLLGDGFPGKEKDGRSWYLKYEIERENDANLFCITVLFYKEERLFILNFYTIMERMEEYSVVFDRITRSFAW